MVEIFETLVALCDEELCHREYLGSYYARLIAHQDKLRTWMKGKELKEFSEEIGDKYLESVYSVDSPAPSQILHDYTRGIPSNPYADFVPKCGEFEFRSPSVEYTFDGVAGKVAFDYLQYCSIERELAQRTLDNKKISV